MTPTHAAENALRPRQRSRASRREAIDFTEYLEAMIGGGLSLEEALEDAEQVFEGGPIAEIARELSSGLRSGTSLALLFDRRQEVFPPYYRRLLAAAEQSGNLVPVLREAGAHLKESLETRGRLLTSLTYPIIVILLLAGFVSILFFSILPRLAQILPDLSAEAQVRLDGILQTIRIEGTMAGIGALTVCGGGGVLVLIHAGGGRGELFVDTLLLRLPFLGPAISSVQLRFFVVALHTLVAAGVSAETALAEAAQTLTNCVLRGAVLEACAEVQDGHSLGVAISRTPVIPARIRRCIAAGENTGSFAALLPSLVEYYRWETERWMRRATTLSEPLLLAVCGAAVTIVVLTVVIPFLALYGSSIS